MARIGNFNVTQKGNGYEADLDVRAFRGTNGGDLVIKREDGKSVALHLSTQEMVDLAQALLAAAAEKIEKS